MHMAHLRDQLTRTLQNAGFDVSTGPVESSVLLDTSDGTFLLSWDPWDGPAETDAAAEAREPARETGTRDGPVILEGDAMYLPSTPREPRAEPAAEPSAAEAPRPRTTAPSEPEPTRAPVVRPRVGVDEVRTTAERKLLKVHGATLELVPHHAYGFDVRVPTGTEAPKTATGTLLFNARTGDLVTLEAPDLAEGTPEGAQVLEGLVATETADESARRHLVTTYTRDVKIEEDDGNVSMVTTRRMAPDPHDVTLESRGTWYLPVWRFEGENGVLRIDAHDGGVLEERLKKPAGTDAEWV